MSFLLDTNICSAHLRRPTGLAHRFMQHGGRLFTSTICIAELYAGAYHLPFPNPLLTKIGDLLTVVSALPFDELSAEHFGRVRGSLLRSGISVNTTDLLIASVALSNKLILVTNNTADFINIPGLRLEDWLTP